MDFLLLITKSVLINSGIDISDIVTRIIISCFFTKNKVSEVIQERDCGDLHQSGSGEMMRSFEFCIYFGGKAKGFLINHYMVLGRYCNTLFK